MTDRHTKKKSWKYVYTYCELFYTRLRVPCGNFEADVQGIVTNVSFTSTSGAQLVHHQKHEFGDVRLETLTSTPLAPDHITSFSYKFFRHFEWVQSSLHNVSCIYRTAMPPRPDLCAQFSLRMFARDILRSSRLH